jgi:hypothetical protein
MSDWVLYVPLAAITLVLLGLALIIVGWLVGRLRASQKAVDEGAAYRVGYEIGRALQRAQTGPTPDWAWPISEHDRLYRTENELIYEDEKRGLEPNRAHPVEKSTG